MKKKPDPKVQRLMSAIGDYMADSNNLGGVTLRSITADLMTGPVQAREALAEIGATEISGKWYLPQDDEPAPVMPVAAPKPVKPTIVREEKQAVEAPKIPLRTQLIDLLKEHPEGVTKEHAMESMAVTLFTFKTVLQKLRREMSIDLVTRNCMSVYVMRDDLSPAPAPVQEIEMQQPEQVQPQPQPMAVQPEPTQQPTNLEGWVFIDSTGTFKTAPRQTAAMAIDAMEQMGNRAIDELIKAQGLRLVKVRVVTDVLFAMGECA